MERAGRLIAKLKSATANLGPEQLAAAAWPAAVGKRLAKKTAVLGLVRDRLVVQVEDIVWQKNLTGLRTQILHNLAELLGPAAPADIEFRIGIPRRPPQRESAAALRQTRLFNDESGQFADPSFAMIYRMSRRKAGA
jgi:hypothetical protein